MNDYKSCFKPFTTDDIVFGFETTEEKCKRLEKENSQLKDELSAERQLRYKTEQEVDKLQNERKRLLASIEQLEKNPPRRKRRTKAEIEAAGEVYNEFKSDGKRKARPSEPIRSYEDFDAIQKFFLSANRIRDWALWVIGISLGLRVSDLLSLKIRDLLNDDGTFKERILLIEQKTSKANNCLITESVKEAVTRYLASLNNNYDLDEYLFKSNKTKGKMFEEYGWKILSDAGKAVNLPIVIGSHTMRKSFANIAACVDKSSIDMNAITKIQGLLNHSDQRVTMRYLGTYQQMFDRARIAVSDFVLGKTDVHELVAGNNYTIDDIMSSVEELRTKILQKQGETQ